MRIVSGLFDHMVMQRNSAGFCEQKICGETSGAKQISILLPDGKKEILAISSAGGKFCGILHGLKTGGPYQITVSDGEIDIVFSDLLVGDVWILAGQSNMQGVGNMQDALPPSYLVRAFYLDNRWDVACDPLHNMDKAAAEIHWVLNDGHHAFDKAPIIPLKGVCAGVSFGQTMVKKTGVPQGLIASAHGGTTMKQWDPGLKNLGENSLYGAMYERFLLNGSKIAGVLWYQGCSDSSKEEDTEAYTYRTLALFKAMRKDFDDDNLPIVLAQLARTTSAYDFTLEKRWSMIREQQRIIPYLISRCVMVPTVDLELDDSIHLSGRAQKILGRRFAEAHLFLRGNSQEYPPMKIGRIEYIERKEFHEYQTIIHVDNVVGSLHSGNLLPNSFSLHEASSDNKLSVPPFRCRLEGDKIVVTASSTLGSKIAYAFGCNAVGNVYDGAMRPLPAFGPLYSHKVYKSTPMLCEVEVSDPVMGEDNFDALDVSKNDLASLHFSKVKSKKTYIEFDRVLEQGEYIRFVKWSCLCRRNSTFRVLFGSDSNFRLFCDGTEILCGNEVANPIIPDEFSADLTLKKGKHDFALGLSGKAGNAWGFCCRFVDLNVILTNQNESAESDNLPLFV